MSSRHTTYGLPWAQVVNNLPAIQKTWVQSQGWEDALKKGTGYPLQYSGLENSMDCIVHGVAESDMTERLSFFKQHNDLVFAYIVK